MADPHGQVLGLRPGRLDLTVMRGDGLSFVAGFFDQDGSPVDVSEWTFEGQVRRTYGGPILAQFVVTVASGGLDDHEIRAEVDAATIWTIVEGSCPWDLVATSGWPSIRTVLAGIVQVLPRATEVA